MQPSHEKISEWDVDSGGRESALSLIEVNANAFTALLGGGRLRSCSPAETGDLVRSREVGVPSHALFYASHLIQLKKAVAQFVADRDRESKWRRN